MRRMLRLAAVPIAALALLVSPAAASAAPTWLPPIDALAASQFSLETQDAVFLASGDVVGLSTTNAVGGKLFATSKPVGGAVLAPVELSSPGLRATSQDLVADGAGRVAAVWSEADTNNNTYRVLAATRSADGTWATVEVRPVSGVSMGDATGTYTSDGTLVVAWTESDRIRTARRPAGAMGFGASQQLGDGASRSPQVVSVGDGATVAAWRDTIATVETIRVARSGPGEPFGPAATASSAATGDTLSGLRAGAAANGRATFVWLRRLDQTTTDVIESSVRTADGTLGLVDTVSDAESEPESLLILPIDLAVNAAGQAVVAWKAANGRTWTARKAPAANEFRLPTPLLNPGSASVPAAAGIDAGGTATVAWFETNRVLASRAPFSGGWTDPEVVDSVANPIFYFGYRPGLAVAPDGDAATFLATLDSANMAATRLRLVPLDVAGPRQSALAIPATGTVGEPVALSLTAFDVWSPFTTSWDFGDGTTGSGSSLTHAFANPGRYTVSATSTDAVGNAATGAGTITVAAAPTAEPTATATATATVTPEPTGTATPEPTETPAITASVKAGGKAGKRSTRIRTLQLSGLPDGTTAQLRCSPVKKCPFTGVRTLTVSGGRANGLEFRSGKQRKRGLVFKVGATLEVRMTLPGSTGQRTTYRFVKKRFPKATTQPID